MPIGNAIGNWSAEHYVCALIWHSSVQHREGTTGGWHQAKQGAFQGCSIKKGGCFHGVVSSLAFVMVLAKYLLQMV